ncbi:RNA polymerase-associated protein [Tolypocladium ophioglossoides CBS 100239]|uniref:RNA polymerase-associated protein n=1 Tax=Tolypocladium ophioglossoides (strain CBS 100239) TaxID=1163406 RepID=A0A0L0MXZ7_TOLOC|nr:RNA polymerase-associated protein [Tolypocladium ophioglossoides CBS 100239]
MADIDDELLALAGGDSEDEGSVSSGRHASASPPPAKDSVKTSAKTTKRRARSNDSEEEGEASSAPSSPNSLESAPMDESDSDVEQPSRERAPPAVAGPNDDDKYPVDGMFMRQTEKAEIMAMREVEREQIIADRISEIERQRQNRLLRQMVTSVENEERKYVKKKRSADTAELEDGERKASRQRTGKASETAMDSLRKARAEKQRRKEDHERRKDGFSPRQDSREPESDDEFERARSRTPEKEAAKDVPPAELRDYERVRLGRNEFAQVCFTPGFEAAITGCYIRISVGAHPDTGIEQYRMAVIKGFTTGRPYALIGPNGPFVTDQYAKGAHGKAIKEFPFIAASSGKFTDSELNRYQITCHNEGITLPTKQFLLNRIDEINGLIKHNWTSEEIKARLARRNELKKRFDPAERERVAGLLDAAVSRGDERKAEKLQEELDKLSSQRLAFRTSLGPSKSIDAPKASSEQDRLAERNRENRRMNAELVRKAQLKEKAKSREIEMALKRGEQVPDDPSRRLRTKAKFVHDVNDTPQKLSQNGSAESTPANGTPKVGAAKPQQMATHLAKLQEKNYEDSKGMPTIHKPLMDDDVIGALDLDIDVEI